MAAVVRASLALLEGRFADADALVESALRSGASSVPWDAVIFSRVQRFALRLEDGRLAEMEPAIRRSAEEFPTRPMFRCLLARLLTELGDEDGARFVFEQLAAARFAGIPVNNDLLLSLAHLAEVAWFLRDAGSGAVLHGLLLPYRGLVVDTLETSTGRRPIPRARRADHRRPGNRGTAPARCAAPEHADRRPPLGGPDPGRPGRLAACARSAG
jgi:hypothetical protein